MLFPLVGAAVMLWIAIEALIGFSGEALWTMGIIGAIGVGLMLMAVLVFRSPFFSLPREAYRPPEDEV